MMNASPDEVLLLMLQLVESRAQRTHHCVMMNSLPDEVLLLMLQLVDARDLGRLACTCRRLAALARDGNSDWKQVAHIDLAPEASAEEKYESMKLFGDRLFVSSLSGRRNLVILDQWLNELGWTSACDDEDVLQGPLESDL
eukprot:TRINITY_DN365_c0_g1_i6.p4 TRINITY_DN365_c0_g1~~TRINITY_DN365_c0_g1_i6.p4  ORF type:complete len:141 (+),score=35.40 TRINITY_DN365_c0_g1_i6:130-552(+)